MDRRSFLGLALGLPMMLTACARSERLRYKLTLSVDTPDGVKTGFSVVEVVARDVSIPARGTMSHARGEAVYIDLGPGRRPLIAIMSRPAIPPGTSNNAWEARRYLRLTWAEGKPDFAYLASRAGYETRTSGIIVDMARFKSLGRVITLTPDDLPDLVTFADIADPASVMAVDPEDLTATLGPGIRWRSMTLEVTDDAVTRGIEKRLPWLVSLQGYLDGKTIRRSNDLPSVLQR